jgi:uncharacterized SAM-binding protein YcdF (DUF218 family)
MTLRRVAALLLVVALAFLALVIHSYTTIPSTNTNLTHFDTIIVLGTPSLENGSPSPEQRSRVREGVSEYNKHIAAHIIVTGGAAHNSIVEAHTMAAFAQSLGVPAEAIIEEGHARNTIENVFFSMAILRQHGWTSAEVVSSPQHLPRASLILSHWPLAWRTHAAPWPPEYSRFRKAAFYIREALECWRLRTFGFVPNPHLPDGSPLLPQSHGFQSH